MPSSHDPESAGSALDHCIRCAYSQRGLPTRHACPECGLAYDEHSERYRVRNPQQVLLLWLMIFMGGFAAAKGLPNLFAFDSVDAGDKFMAIVAVIWIGLAGVGVFFTIRRYRRGQEIAITADGLYLRLFGFDEALIPWSAIGKAEIKKIPETKPQIALLRLPNRRGLTEIGGVANLFPTKPDVERFVEQINDRARGPDQPDAPAGGDR